MIGKKVLHYEILDKLGEGGMGTVYLAEDTKLNRKVALKFLSSAITSDEIEIVRFRNEARIAASLSHPNIAQIYAMEDSEEGSFISMQYVTGRNLKDYISDESPDMEQRVEIAFRLLQGLAAADKKGIIHRDIKASNIMINDEGQVKILDFGLARYESSVHMTTAGETRGTALYMAPELIMGQEATVQSDIWAYGVVLYQLFTKELPFDGVYEQAISYAILDEDPRPIAEIDQSIPANIEAIITRCLEKKPENRYSNFDEINEDFEKEELSYKAKGGSPKEKATKGKKNLRQYSYIGGSVVLLIAIIISLLNTDILGARDAGPKKLAIIPFKNIGDIAENGILLDGILETMTSKLSQIDNYKETFWVIPSSEVIIGDVRTPQEAYKQFRADLAVTGSLQDISGTKRLTINLIDAQNLRQLHSSVMDISGDNILNLQSEMVLELIGMLDIRADNEINKTLQAGITDNPQSSAYYVNGKGYLSRYQNDENLENAITLFKQAIDEDPNYALAYAALGESFWRKFELTKVTAYVDSAQNYLDQAKMINEDLIPVKQTIALILTGTGRYEEAIKQYEEILKQDPGSEEVYGAMGEAYQQLGKYEDAEKYLKKAVALKPNYWLEYKRLGIFYYMNADFEKAIEQFEQIIKLAPDNILAYTYMGAAHLYLGNIEQALYYQKKSYDLEPTYRAASNYGTTLRYNGDFRQALKYYKIATELSPNSYAGWGNLASLYGIMGDEKRERENYLRAIEEVEKLLQINPNSIELNIGLGSYYSDIGEKEKAYKFIDISLELAPESADVLFRAGSAYEKLGDRSKAIEMLKKAVEAGYPLESITSERELYDLVKDPAFEEVVNSAS